MSYNNEPYNIKLIPFKAIIYLTQICSALVLLQKV